MAYAESVSWNERPLVVLITSVWLHIPSIQDGKQQHACMHTLYAAVGAKADTDRYTAFNLVLVGWVPNAHVEYRRQAHVCAVHIGTNS